MKLLVQLKYEELCVYSLGFENLNSTNVFSVYALEKITNTSVREFYLCDISKLFTGVILIFVYAAITDA